MLKLSFRYRFEAAHRFLGSASAACRTPHGHTWYANLKLHFRGDQLNADNMAVEFSQIKGDWRQLITETFDHSYMHNWQDSLVSALRADHPEARLIPFPGDPTTELIALLMFQKMETITQAGPYKDLVEVAAITIEETPTNQIECSREFFLRQIGNYKKFSGWWQTRDIGDRQIAQV